MKYGSVIVTEKKLEAYKKETAALVRRFLRLMGENDGYVEIYLVGNKFMEKNVLSFPAPNDVPRPDIKGKMLGEVYLNPIYIKSKKENFKYMLIHGLLHLLGYDHKRKTDRIVMEQKENELLVLLLDRQHPKKGKRT
ncbi:MAG: rRNA maturation RNase YbeY [Candidatus Harrisonbacteria bacterium CG10_big_fil_rev_8_21_14_0_10_40_38]|uniref:rRNA maturation RNase YbeY n=1 Tax=Candidatus Harrisonbacteria bacterium CG10_big_fil_rev_8_21_14_0_10_40_38 TaxID=1974583 RepID=A0A2H0URS5_9BACT|nr:MAG: rRNA maturation RNase YbeY [Candidatus Harrisonbacteria bacterium CG10_big_fil_rev_8_21_14_0_10_40_38]